MNRPNAEFLVACLVSFALPPLLALAAMGLSFDDLRFPLSYFGDAVFSAALVKGTLVQGWYMTNGDLGAPHGLRFFDWPMAESLHFLQWKALGLFGMHWVTATNLVYLASFGWTALFALVFFRFLKIPLWISVGLAVTYGLLPYHFQRGVGHLFLSFYYLVPLGLLLVWDSFPGDSQGPWGTVEGRCQAFLRSVSGRMLISLAIGCAGAYYALFTLFFLVMNGIRLKVQQPRETTARYLLLPVVVITLALAANLAPSWFFQAAQSPNLGVGQRSPAEAEIYALKGVQLVLPIQDHGLPLLRGWIETYRSFPLNNEETEYVGLAGIFGLLLALGSLFTRTQGDSHFHRVRWLLGAGFLLGTIGGLGSVISLTVSSKIRAYNRVSVFLAVLCLALAGLALAGWYRRHPKFLHRLAMSLALLVFLSLGIFDQIHGPHLIDTQAIRNAYLVDQSFVRDVEASIPPGSKVFQLPHVKFPEGGQTNMLGAYEPLKMYLHSRRLAWSTGTMWGRPEDSSNRTTANLAPPKMVAELKAQGFAGVCIHRDGYPAGQTNVELEITKALGKASATSDDSKIAFYPIP